MNFIFRVLSFITDGKRIENRAGALSNHPSWVADPNTPCMAERVTAVEELDFGDVIEYQHYDERCAQGLQHIWPNNVAKYFTSVYRGRLCLLQVTQS